MFATSLQGLGLPAYALTLLFPPAFRRIWLPGKGVEKLFCNIFLLGRGTDPKLLRQHILLILVLRVSDPKALSNS